MPVTRQHLNKYGYSERCSKCRDVQQGNRAVSRKGHTKACRARVVGLAMEDPEFREQARAGAKRKGGQAAEAEGEEEEDDANRTKDKERKKRKEEADDKDLKKSKEDVAEEPGLDEDFMSWIERQSEVPRGGPRDPDEPNRKTSGSSSSTSPSVTTSATKDIAECEIPLPTVHEEEEPPNKQPRLEHVSAAQSCEDVLRAAQGHSMAYVAISTR